MNRNLAKSKGKITKHFFMKRLVVLAHFQLAQQFFKEQEFFKKTLII
jgi:hypothetical protein